MDVFSAYCMFIQYDKGYLLGGGGGSVVEWFDWFNRQISSDSKTDIACVPTYRGLSTRGHNMFRPFAFPTYRGLSAQEVACLGSFYSCLQRSVGSSCNLFRPLAFLLADACLPGVKIKAACFFTYRGLADWAVACGLLRPLAFQPTEVCWSVV